MQRLGLGAIRVDRSTANLIKDFDADSPGFLRDRRDRATAESIVRLLAQVWLGEVLQPATAGVLMDAMRRCQTGACRLPGLLPPRTKVAHKTGTLGAVANDVGVITLPDGSRVAIAVLSVGAAATEPERIAPSPRRRGPPSTSSCSRAERRHTGR